jgi:hypothetical protein
MEIKIGVQNISREITLDTDDTADAVAKAIAEGMAGATIEFHDGKGRRVIVPSAALGYVEMGSEEKRRVGFGG